MLKLDHAVFPVRNAAATLRFYREVAGLPLIGAHTGDDWGGYPWLMMIFGLSGGQHLVCVELRGAPAHALGGLPADVRHYALSVGSAAERDDWRARLEAAGVQWWEETHGDQVSLYFPDPDGVILEVTWPPSPEILAEDAAALATVAAWQVPGAA